MAKSSKKCSYSRKKLHSLGGVISMGGGMTKDQICYCYFDYVSVIGSEIGKLLLLFSPPKGRF